MIFYSRRLSLAKCSCLSYALIKKTASNKNFPTELIVIGDLECQIHIRNIDHGAKFFQLLSKSNYIKNVLPAQIL